MGTAAAIRSAPLPPAVVTAARGIAAILNEPLYRANTHGEGRVILNILETNRIGPADLAALFDALRRIGLYREFVQTAHPRWGPYVRGWLIDQGVSWQAIHDAYEYDVRDSLDFYAGFLAGMGFAIADLPVMIVKLARIIVDGRLAEEAGRFFDAVYALWNSDLVKLLGDSGAKWLAEFEELIFQLRWFEAGAKLGNCLATLAMMGEGAVRLAAALPKFVKMVPVMAREAALVIDRAAIITVRTAEQAAIFVKAVWGVLFVVPDFRFSALLPALVAPGELRALLAGGVRTLTRSGFELVFVESTRASEHMVVVRSGVLPSDFVPASVVLVRREGKLIGRIFDPHSLARAWKTVGDADFDAALDALLKSPGAPALPADPDAMAALRKLCETARTSSDFAAGAARLNLRHLAEELAQVASKRAQEIAKRVKAMPGFKPSAASFGAQVEIDMRHIIQKWTIQHAHLVFHRGQSLKTILRDFLPEGSKLLEMTVEDFVRSRPDLAKMIGFDGRNLAKVLAADGRTPLGSLKLDLFVRDPFGHQGVLLDFTSFMNEAHFNKTLLYHAVVTTAFPKMRLPFGEMFHFGLTQ
ncbi:hypothetical protein [Sphingomonas colocasiae]|uniref:Uncharacterized protein n=1 Tax=Sphingomonas colocasiae TaxID=1848973 RepID=A0ABS7Q0X4_9SPHN|nr:hypothetical protein [Sphingomonas colocasiae]MBY8826187.1 hypothetical protein [Sphingomonas colocasiae]